MCSPMFYLKYTIYYCLQQKLIIIIHLDNHYILLSLKHSLETQEK